MNTVAYRLSSFDIIQIKKREEFLKPVYLQAANEFADLHDKTGRMKAKKVIRDAVPWELSRQYFYNRVNRRTQEGMLAKRLQDASKGSMSRTSAVETLASMYDGNWEDDTSVLEFFEKESDLIEAKIKTVRNETLRAQMAAIEAELAQE